MIKRRKTKQGAKPANQSRSQAQRRKPPHCGVGVDGRRVAAAIHRFEKAYRLAGARADDLLSVANRIADAAIVKQGKEIVREWADRQFLRDLISLCDIFSAQPAGSLPVELEALRLLPDALLQWIEQRFGVEPISRTGEVRELPAAKLEKYACDFEKPHDPTTLVRVRVVSSGWKHGAIILIPPRVCLVPAQSIDPE